MDGVLWTATLEGKCNVSADLGLSSYFETEFLVKKMRTENSWGVSTSSLNQSYKFIHDIWSISDIMTTFSHHLVPNKKNSRRFKQLG